MAVYLVTWDLNKEKANYSDARTRLINHLSRYEHIRDPGLDSVWFVSTNWTPDQIQEDLKKVVDRDDRFIISRLRTSEYQGWLNQNIWDWINARIG